MNGTVFGIVIPVLILCGLIAFVLYSNHLTATSKRTVKKKSKKNKTVSKDHADALQF